VGFAKTACNRSLELLGPEAVGEVGALGAGQHTIGTCREMSDPRTIFFSIRGSETLFMQFWARTFVKLAWLIFLMLTSAYCLLAYLPYTFYAVIKAPPNEWMPWFVAHHAHVYWALLLCSVIAYRPQLRRTRDMSVMGSLTLLGILLTTHPILRDLQSNFAAYMWSVAALVPILAIALHEIISWWPKAPARAQGSVEYFPIILAAITAAILTIFGAEIPQVGSRLGVGFHAKNLDLWLWSLVSHVMVAVLGVSLLNLIAAVAAKTSRPREVRTGTIAFLTWISLCFGLENLLASDLSFQGFPSVAYATLLSSALMLFGYSIILAVSSRNAGTGFPARARKPVWAAVLVGTIALTLPLPYLVVDWDWNSLIQRICTLLLWGILSAGFYQILGRRRTYSVPAILAVILIAGFSYKALQATEFIWARPLGTGDEDVAASIEQYGSRNISLQLADHLLGNAPATEACGELCRVLRQYTNVRNATTSTEIKLVDPLVPTSGQRPNIFIFVVDSMRPDYLGAYNPKVDFTPNIDSLARESTVFRSAYSQYAGTTLSEPAIWSGAMLLHAHFLRPFSNVNSLEKLARADGYQMFVSFDTILKVILSPADDLVKLDTDKPAWNEFEMCSTVQQLSSALDERSDKTRPVFFYAQPMNVHMFARNRQPIGSINQWDRPGFERRLVFEVHQVDECMGRFVSYLKSRGMYDNSVVILTSDHGDATGEFGRRTHSYIIYPEVMHVPLIVHLPKAMQDAYVNDRDGLSALTDITPSLYYLLGHHSVRSNPMFGRPLFVKTQEETERYRRSELFLASDTVAAYGLIDDSGRRLYATYDSPARSFLFDLAHDPNAEHSILKKKKKKKYDQKIIDYLKMIADFYGYRPGIGSLLASKK